MFELATRAAVRDGREPSFSAHFTHDMASICLGVVACFELFRWPRGMQRQYA